MKQRYTSDKYRKALRTRLLYTQDIKEKAVRKIMAAALSVKQFENRLLDTSSKHTLTPSEKHQLKLATETKEKLIDVAARFEVSVLDDQTK